MRRGARRADFSPAPLVPVPLSIGTRRVPNGQEVISIVGGLELNTPVWANEQHEFPYLQWQIEVHRAKLKAALPARRRTRFKWAGRRRPTMFTRARRAWPWRRACPPRIRATRCLIW